MIDHYFGCRLGPLDRVYIDRIRHWRNDEKIRKWCRQYTVLADADHERWFESQGKDPSIRMFAIHRRSQGVSADAMVGVAGLTSIDLINRRAEFSLYIAPDTHRKGIGRQALATLLSHGFNDLGLHSIWGESFDQNPAIQLFVEIGFKADGTRRDFYFRDGRFINSHLFSITGEEWNQHSSQVRSRSLAHS